MHNSATQILRFPHTLPTQGRQMLRPQPTRASKSIAFGVYTKLQNGSW